MCERKLDGLAGRRSYRRKVKIRRREIPPPTCCVLARPNLNIVSSSASPPETSSDSVTSGKVYFLPPQSSRQNCCRKPCRKDTGGTPCAILSGLFHRTPLGKTLLQENEEDGEHKADERRDVVPVESLAFEEEGDNQSEDDEGDNLLDNF